MIYSTRELFIQVPWVFIYLTGTNLLLSLLFLFLLLPIYHFTAQIRRTRGRLMHRRSSLNVSAYLGTSSSVHAPSTPSETDRCWCSSGMNELTAVPQHSAWLNRERSSVLILAKPSRGGSHLTQLSCGTQDGIRKSCGRKAEFQLAAASHLKRIFGVLLSNPLVWITLPNIHSYCCFT